MPSNDTGKTSKTRRRFLAITAGATAGLAGCTGGGGDGSGGGGGSTGGGGGSTGGGDGGSTGGGGDSGGGGGSTGGGGGPSPSQAKTVGGVTIPSGVVQRANEEGEVVLYSTMDEPDIVGMFKPAFEEHFPDITVEGAGFGSGEISTKLLSEFQANQVTGDVAELNLGTARAVSRTFNGYADGHWLKEAAAEVGYADPYFREGAFEFPGHGNAYTLVYNTNLTTESEAPDSWEELGDDQWTGEMGIVMQHPSNLSSIGGLYATLYGLWGEEKWIEQVGRLMDNQPQLISSNSQSYRVMIQGERALSPNYLNDLASQLDAGESPPAAAKWLDPALLNFSPSCITKNAPHPNAAMALVAWFMSEDGQSIVGDTGRTPLLPQVATSHDIVQQIVPEGVELLPTAYNNPTYNGANFLTEPQAWTELFNEHFGEQ